MTFVRPATAAQEANNRGYMKQWNLLPCLFYQGMRQLVWGFGSRPASRKLGARCSSIIAVTVAGSTTIQRTLWNPRHGMNKSRCNPIHWHVAWRSSFRYRWLLAGEAFVKKPSESKVGRPIILPQVTVIIRWPVYVKPLFEGSSDWLDRDNGSVWMLADLDDSVQLPRR